MASVSLSSCKTAYLGCLVVAVLACARPAIAQYQVESWTTENGLPQNVVGGILQTRDGYIWLSTRDGLVRFDGVRFTVFDRNNSSGIRNNRFTTLYEAPDGAIWAGTEGGGVTRYANGAFSTYSTPEGLPSNQVYGVTGDAAGNIWVLSGGQILQWDGPRFRPVSTGVAGPFYQSEWNPRVFLAIDRDGLHRFANGSFSVRSLPRGVQGLSNNRFEEDAEGTLWMGTIDGRVARVRDDSVRFDVIADLDSDKAVLASSYQDRSGHTWPLNVSRALGRFWSVPGAPGAAVRLKSLFEDLEGNLWLGADGNGLYRIRRSRVTVYSTAQGMLAHNIYPVFTDRTGSVWTGAWPSGMSRITNGHVQNYTIADGLPSGFVTSIAEDRDGRIWVAGHSDTNGGLRVFNNGRFRDVPQRIVPNHSVVHAIVHDRAGAVWIGTNVGLSRYQDGTTTTFTTADGLSGNDVNAIIEDQDGLLWMGTDRGISVWKAGSFHNWSERDGLPSGVVRSLNRDRDGVLWVGTYDGGLGRYKDGKFNRFTTREGLYDNGVFQILDDGRGYLWMSSNRGIHRVRKRDLDAVAQGTAERVTALSIGRGDGLLSAECNGGTWPAGSLGANGTLWFPTQDGVAVIDPDTFTSSAGHVPPHIESVLVDRTSMPTGAPIRILPGQQALEIQYTGLSLVNSERIRFRYRLTGLDHDWVDAGTRRTAYYSHIPPGDYTFTVMAAGSDGEWASRVATLSIRVVPPVWRTWWFLSMAIAATAGAAGFAYHRRVAALENARATQERFARQLIDSQEQERRRIAAELHDSLGQHLMLIKTLAMLGPMNGSDGVKKQLDEITASATHSIAEVRDIAYNLRPYHLDTLGLATSIEAMAERISASSGIEVSVTLPPTPLDGALPQDQEINVYRIVQEALNNIVKHSGATRATIDIGERGREFVIRVADNGKGFNAKASRAATMVSGLGLVGVAERVGMLGGRHSIGSAPGDGTTLTIVLPRRVASEGRA